MEAKHTYHVRLDPQSQPYLALPVLQVGFAPSVPTGPLLASGVTHRTAEHMMN